MGGAQGDREALGARIHMFRSMRKISVRKLAEAAGVSAAFISQIENGKANASFDVLRKLASALGLTLADLFQASDASSGKVLRRSERPQLTTAAGVLNYIVSRPPLRDVEVIVSEYASGAVSGDHEYTHGDSREIVVVLRGCFSFELDGAVFAMEEGDSLDFRTNVPHMITNVGEGIGEAIWVVSPPSS